MNFLSYYDIDRLWWDIRNMIILKTSVHSIPKIEAISMLKSLWKEPKGYLIIIHMWLMDMLFSYLCFVNICDVQHLYRGSMQSLKFEYLINFPWNYKLGKYFAHFFPLGIALQSTAWHVKIFMKFPRSINPTHELARAENLHSYQIIRSFIN